ncbi:APC family permease [Streptacidiphilus rugosus]|uniref:APC family permease n=1 Tax=Streptacidiphilus rugosus TaxID=405783 RepID=UPI00056883B2|nr:APC family permease [Streptacidiphilus rugosus]
MTTTSTAPVHVTGAPRGLQRNLGFWGLMFVSLGSIIGSGWLLGALTAATVAGPASLISWALAAVMLLVIALVHAELGAAYPFAGGTARFPSFAFGPLAAFTAGWMTFLQAVTIAPIEVEATLSYTAHIGWVSRHVTILDPHGDLTWPGIAIASAFLLLFTLINLVGVRMLSDSNAVAVVWKTLVPLLTVVVLVTLSFHAGNFTAGGGFMPFGVHGVFAALPAGVVFALQGFEQAIQMAGEARRPQQDVSRAVIVSTVIGMVVYLLLEAAFIGALVPANLVHGWASPIGAGAFGPYAQIASALGVGWLAFVLYLDAVVSPAATGLVYVGTTARITYAMGRERSLPAQLARINVRGVPVWSILAAFVIGELCLLPFPSWQSLVGLVTSATMIMYAYAPVALHALRLRDPFRHRPYRTPAWRVLSPLAFVFANLTVYWSGFEANWKICASLALGLTVFAGIRRLTPAEARTDLHWRSALWIAPWLGGMLLIGYLGRYGTAARGILPNWWDLATVTAYSLAVYYYAVRKALPAEAVVTAVAADESRDLPAPPATAVA